MTSGYVFSILFFLDITLTLAFGLVSFMSGLFVSKNNLSYNHKHTFLSETQFGESNIKSMKGVAFVLPVKEKKRGLKKGVMRYLVLMQEKNMVEAIPQLHVYY